MDKCFTTIQWHITEKCNNNCRHCYMSKDSKDLSKNEILKILENIDDFEEKWKFEVSEYIITGGDPLLSNNIEFIFEELKKRNKRISILGNPDTVTDTSIKLLKKYGVENFQLSLDGLKEKHDYIRKNGSFDLTLEKAKLLIKNDIAVNIMFTVNKENYQDVIPLMEIVAKNNITSFSFDFLCSIGNGKELKTLTSKEVEDLLKAYLIEKDRLRKSYDTFFHEKSSLFRKLRGENNNFILHKIMKDNRRYLGCYIGFTSFAISSDGAFMPCRRLGEKYENLLSVKLEDIFLSDIRLKKYRRSMFYKECGECLYFNFCRGCPAISKSESGNSLEKPSICSSKVENSNKLIDIGLETSKDEERKLIAEHYINIFFNNIESYISKSKSIRELILLFTFEPEIREEFLGNPNDVLKELNIHCNSSEIEIVGFYVELLHMGYSFDLSKYLFGGF